MNSLIVINDDGSKRVSETIRNDTLTPRQERVACHLAAGDSIEAAARKCGNVAVPTVKKWLATVPAFKRRIREIQAEVTARAKGILVEGIVEASYTLRQLLRSNNESIRLKAADSLLTRGSQLSALAELQEHNAMPENDKG